jgi:CRISPR/Cas system-associated protein Csm6
MGLAKGELKKTNPGAMDDDAMKRKREAAEKKRKMMEELAKQYKKEKE